MPRPSEDDLIARFLAPLAGAGGLGLRDDAALATPPPGHDLVVTKDMLVAGVHFFPDDAPDAIARKALRVNLSDLAAKGAAPTGFLLGLALPHDWTEPWLADFTAGLADDARAFGCPLLGGDTVGTPGPLTLSVTAFGIVPAGRMVPRTGALPGAKVYVTGTVGDAVLGLRIRWNRPEDEGWIAALDPGHRDALLARHLRPEPRLSLRDALRDHACAAMDVSDGFGGDLSKMLRREGLTTTVALAAMPFSPAVAAVLHREPRLLAAVLGGGDDYEILCCVPPEAAAGFEAAARRAAVPVTAVGVVRSHDVPVTLIDGDRRVVPLEGASFQHFA